MLQYHHLERGGSRIRWRRNAEIIGRAAAVLHERLVGTVSVRPEALSRAPACAACSADNDNGDGDDDGGNAAEVGSYQCGDSVDDLAADADAAVAARSIVAAATRTNGGVTSTSSSVSSSSSNGDNGDDTDGSTLTVRLTSELLRSIKNLIRYSNSSLPRRRSGLRRGDLGRFSRRSAAGTADDDDE